MARVKILDKKKSRVTPSLGGRTVAPSKGKRVYKKQVTQYKNKAGVVFTVGDRVHLNTRALTLFKRNEGGTFAGNRITQTRIASLFPDIPGYVRLQTRLGGYWTWSVEDLIRVED